MTLPPLPEPFDWCYEWDGPYGTRKFSAATHNGNKPTRSRALFDDAQMRAYGEACALAERARCAQVVEGMRILPGRDFSSADAAEINGMGRAFAKAIREAP